VGTRSGSLLAINTLGAIVGTFVVPFILIPLIGSPFVLALTAAANALTGVVIGTNAIIRPRVKRAVIVMAGVFFPVLAGMLVARTLVDPNVVRLRQSGATLYRSEEDEIAAVQSGEADGRKQLWVTGFSMTFLTVDAKLMPLLPMMLRPDSKSVLTIAFGMGSSFRSALIAGLNSDAVELVPSVPSMFSEFYPDAQTYTSSPQGRILIADGRNYVELTDKHYDIIVVDPPPPLQSSGVSIISSREFYAASLKRLNPAGVMMQWVPWGQRMDDFKTHVRTFKSVFSNVIVASGPGGNGFYMLGCRNPIQFEEPNIRSVLSRRDVVDDISSAYDSPAHDSATWEALIPKLVRLAGDDVSRFAGSGPLITDDRPLPEYFLLRSAKTPTAWLNPAEVKPPSAE
jgi:spermidine synthase